MSYSFLNLSENDASPALRYADISAFSVAASLDAARFFTTDSAEILKRQKLLRAVSENKRLYEFVGELALRAHEYSDMCRERVHTRENNFITLVDARFYTSLIKYIIESADAVGQTDSVFDEYFALCRSEGESEQFRALSDNLAKLASTVNDIRSVTIGVNLSSSLKPLEAGLVGINDKPFRSGNFCDRLFRLDFEDDGFVCMAPLTRYGKGKSYAQRTALNTTCCEALGEVMTASLKNARAVIDGYFYKKANEIIPSERELGFITRSCAYIERLREAGAYFCYPEISCGVSSARGLYDPSLLGVKTFADIVANDAVFSGADKKSDGGESISSDNTSTSADADGKNRRIYILTGPNSGGKTVYLRAVGTMQLLFQCGLPVPAKSASLMPCDNISTSFPTYHSGENTNREGRLEEECRFLASMLSSLGRRSLVLCDEVYSSTSASDALSLAENLLRRFGDADCMCIFATHLHKLSQTAPEYCGRLAAGTHGTDRTYKISRGIADDSGALAIASKYGLV